MQKKICRMAAVVLCLLVYGVQFGAPVHAAGAGGAIAKAMTEAGLNKCLQRIHDVSEFVVGEGDYGSIVLFDRDAGDSAMVSIVLGKANQNSNYLATLDFSQNDNCSATYEITRFWSDACEAVLLMEFDGYESPQQLPGGFTTRKKSETLYVMSRTVGESACLTIQKELIF